MDRFSEFIQLEYNNGGGVLTLGSVLLAITIVFLVLSLVYQSWLFGGLAIVSGMLIAGITTVSYWGFVKYKNLD